MSVPNVEVPNVFTAAVVWSDALERVLLPEERKVLKTSWAKKRSSDFILGRAAAHKACERLGVEPVPVLRADDGAPLWPEDLVGSISHHNGIGLAAVSKRGHYRGIGVDIEEHSDRPLKALSRIATQNENSWVAASRDPELWACALFASKEALYKALSPLCKRYIGFQEVVLTGDLETKCLIPSLAKPLKDDIGAIECIQVELSWNDRFLVALAYVT